MISLMSLSSVPIYECVCVCVCVCVVRAWGGRRGEDIVQKMDKKFNYMRLERNKRFSETVFSFMLSDILSYILYCRRTVIFIDIKFD